MASPTEERAGMDFHDFHLDMNLDDMEGIVDPTLANAPPQVPTTQSVSSSQPSTTFSSLGLQGALSESIATTVSTGGSSSGSMSSGSLPPLGRQLVGEADRQGQQFSRSNPFSQSPGSSIDVRVGTPPSPQNLSPKGVHPHIGLNTQPRRPSQLRNVKISSFDSEASSSDAPDSALQPLAPAWAAAGPATQTVFNDPFGGSSVKPRTADGSSPASLQTGSGSTFPTPQAGSESTVPNQPGFASDGKAPAIAPPGAAAWAAPESWGVEADEEEEPEEPDGESPSEPEDEDWVRSDEISPSERGSADKGTGTASAKAPPFGYASMGRASGQSGTGRGRPKTGAGRPSTANKSESRRPGTSGSIHASTVPVSHPHHEMSDFPLIISTG